MLPFDKLIAEADRQLTICNACRYCEGYCGVFPSLARRRELSPGDVVHLSNLCHDCRACYYACMYTPPHEFGVNPPQVLSQVRAASYDEYLGASSRWLQWRVGSGRMVAVLALFCLMLIGGVAAASEGWQGIFGEHRSGSPYEVIGYGPLLAVVVVPFLVSCWTIARSATRYWARTHAPLRSLFDVGAHRQAADAALKLRYLRGGGGECFYPDDAPSPVRRRLHSAVAYGFTFCVLSTVSAGVMQDIGGSHPPYSVLSVPVFFGLLGGLGLLVGSTGLIVLKVRADPDPGDIVHWSAGSGFVVALDVLAATGVLALAFRHGAGFGIVLVLHLAAVVACFALAPYTRFVHFIYHYLALVKEAIEIRAAARAASEADGKLVASFES